MNILARKVFPPLKQALRSISGTAPTIKLREIIKQVDPQSTIRVSSATKLIIRPYDLLDCPDANTLRASITTSCSESTAELSVEVNGSAVDVTSSNVVGSMEKIQCVLEIPIKADLNIQAEEDVEASNMHGSFFRVLCNRDVYTKNIHGASISIESLGGNIKTSGILLANNIALNTKGNGNLQLDKLQGDIFHCKTEYGNISTNSCYVDASNFATEKGTLNLKNVHKKSEIYVFEEGYINMTGIHGNVYIKSNGGDMNLQFSEIYGDNIIMAGNSREVMINISDLIEENCFIEIHSDQLFLEQSALHLSKYVEQDNYLNMGKEHDARNKLLICTKGQLRLGKMSWLDGVKMSMSNKKLWFVIVYMDNNLQRILKSI